MLFEIRNNTNEVLSGGFFFFLEQELLKGKIEKRKFIQNFGSSWSFKTWLTDSGRFTLGVYGSILM